MIFKNIVCFLCLFLLPGSFVVGDSSFQINQQLDLGMVKNDKINDVLVKFCEDGLSIQQLSSELALFLRPGQAKDVCVVLYNKSTQSITLLPEILVAGLNDQGNIVCSNNTALTGDIFVQDFGDFGKSVVLAPGEQFIGNFRVKVLNSGSGKYYGCFGISSDIQALSKDSPLYLKLRKAIYMNLSVEGGVYYFQWWDDFLSLISRYQRSIAWTGIALCSLGLLYFAIPLMYPHKKKSKKTPKHTL